MFRKSAARRSGERIVKDLGHLNYEPVWTPLTNGTKSDIHFIGRHRIEGVEIVLTPQQKAWMLYIGDDFPGSNVVTASRTYEAGRLNDPTQRIFEKIVMLLDWIYMTDSAPSHRTAAADLMTLTYRLFEDDANAAVSRMKANLSMLRDDKSIGAEFCKQLLADSEALSEIAPASSEVSELLSFIRLAAGHRIA